MQKGTKTLEALVKLQVAVYRRDWDLVEKGIEKLTETILADFIRPATRTVTIFSGGTTRYAGNSGLSGGCTLAAA